MTFPSEHLKFGIFQDMVYPRDSSTNKELEKVHWKSNLVYDLFKE